MQWVFEENNKLTTAQELTEMLFKKKAMNTFYSGFLLLVWFQYFKQNIKEENWIDRKLTFIKLMLNLGEGIKILHIQVSSMMLGLLYTKLVITYLWTSTLCNLQKYKSFFKFIKLFIWFNVKLYIFKQIHYTLYQLISIINQGNSLQHAMLANPATACLWPHPSFRTPSIAIPLSKCIRIHCIVLVNSFIFI